MSLVSIKLYVVMELMVMVIHVLPYTCSLLRPWSRPNEGQ